MAIRKVTVRVDARCGQPGLASCGCNGDGSGSKLILLPRDPAIVLSGAGFILGAVVGQPRDFAKQSTGKLSYTLYDVEYDDALLVLGTVLSDCDLIFKCCEGCEVTYVNRRISQLCSNIRMTEVPGTDESPAQLSFSGCSGDPVLFDLGPREILIPDPQDCAGVGVDFGVQSVQRAGDSLEILGSRLGASSIIPVAAGENPIAVNVSNVGLYARCGAGVQLDVTVPALSQCYPMNIFYTLDTAFVVDLALNWGGNLEVQGREDANPFGLFSANSLTCYVRRAETFGIFGHGLHEVAAGLAKTFSFYPQIRTIAGAAGSQFSAWNMGFRALVVTKKG